MDDEHPHKRKISRLTDLQVTEASLVDKPANPYSKVLLWKSDPMHGSDRPSDPYRSGTAMTVTERGGSAASDPGYGARIDPEPNIFGTADITNFDEVFGVGITNEEDGRWWIVDADGGHVDGPYNQELGRRLGVIQGWEAVVE